MYDAYGTVRLEDTATSASKHRFVGALGHPSEYETGLIYMRARYMDAETGRFISEDPAGDGTNWYVYCNNDPVNAVDPTGQFAILDVMAGTLDGQDADAVNAANAQLAKKHGENAIQRALYKWTEQYADNCILEVLFGEDFVISNSVATRLQFTGVGGRYGIGIDLSGGQITVKTYENVNGLIRHILRDVHF